MGGTAANRLTSANSGFDGTSLGASGGNETHTLITSEIPSHTHTGTTGNASANHTHNWSANTGNVSNGHSHSYSVSSYQGATSGAGNTRATWTQVGSNTGDINANHTHSVSGGTSGDGSAHTHSFTSATTGGGSAHRNVQPSMIINYIIKV
jgi:microcystin-dependent protein